MKKAVSILISLILVITVFSGCSTSEGTEFFGIVIGSYKDYISVTTLDERVDFYDANIVVNLQSLNFKVANGDILQITIKSRGVDDFEVVKIEPESVKKIDNNAKKVDNAEAKKLINNGAVIVDARSLDEYNMGHIKNAVCLTYKTMEKNYKTLLTNKDAEILVYAGSEETALLTARHLICFGFKNVYTLGSINNYNEELEL